MKKIISLSVIGITLINMSVMPVSAAAINNSAEASINAQVSESGSQFTIETGSDGNINIPSGTENVKIVVNGSENEDIVLRLFDEKNSLVYTDVILAPDNKGGENVFEFIRPSQSSQTYTAAISCGNTVKTVAVVFQGKTPSNNGSSGGGGGGGGNTMSSESVPWTATIEEINKEIINATTEKTAIDIVKKITEKTGTDETWDISKKEDTSEKVTNTLEDISSNINKVEEKADNSNMVSISDKTITSETVKKINDTLQKLSDTVTEGGVSMNRGLFAGCTVKTSFNKSKEATIRVEKSVFKTTSNLDTITVEDKGFSVSYGVSDLKEMMGDNDYLDIKVSQPEVDDNSAIKKVKVDFSIDNVKTMKVSFPGITGDTKYMSVVDENGNPVGGKYNPLTGCIEAKINAAGVYSVIVNEKDYIDIKNKSAEVQEAIKVLAAKGIINGTSETEFSPDDQITRAEIAALILRILAKNDPNADGGFADVNQQNWFFGTAGSAKKYGLINGYEDNTFRGENVILNDQLTAIAARVLKKEMRYITPSNINDYLKFGDADQIADWAREDIATARMADIVLMTSDGSFKPLESMTRANAALVIMRMYNKIK